MQTNMSNSSVYDDLNINTDLGTKVLQLQQQNDNLYNHIESLEKDVQKLCAELVKMKTIEENLKRNISELYKTAKTEIERKDRMIAELRSELDSLLFRRKNRYEANGTVEVTFSSRSEYRHNNKRNREDAYVEDESVGNKKVKCEPVDETISEETKLSDDNKKKSTSRSSSAYSYDQYRDQYQSHKSNIHKSNSKERDRYDNDSKSQEKDRIYSNKERCRSRRRDRDRHSSSRRESFHRQDKFYNKLGSDYNKNSARHDHKHHSSVKDGNKSEISQDQNDRKLSKNKDDTNYRNNSSLSKCSNSSKDCKVDMSKLKSDKKDENIKLENTNTEENYSDDCKHRLKVKDERKSISEILQDQNDTKVSKNDTNSKNASSSSKSSKESKVDMNNSKSDVNDNKNTDARKDIKLETIKQEIIPEPNNFDNYKHHSRVEDESKSVSEVPQDRNNKKVSKSKDDVKSNSSKSSKTSKNSKVDKKYLKIDDKNIRKGEIILESNVPVNKDERNPEVKSNVPVKHPESDLCKNEHFSIIDHIKDDSMNITKDLNDTEDVNLDNTTFIIPYNAKENVKENQNVSSIITNNSMDTIVAQPTKTEDVISKENNLVNSTEVSTDVRGEQTQSDKVKLNTRRRRCVIRIIN